MGEIYFKHTICRTQKDCEDEIKMWYRKNDISYKILNINTNVILMGYDDTECFLPNYHYHITIIYQEIE